MVQSMQRRPARYLREIHRKLSTWEKAVDRSKEASLSIHCDNWLEGNGTPACVALFVFRLSRSHALAVMATCLVVLNPNTSHYSVFVKQYASDEMITALLLLLAAWTFEDGAQGRLRVAAVAAIGAMFLSFTSVFSGSALFAVATLSALRDRFLFGTSPWPVVRVVGWFMGGAVLIYVGYLSGRSNPALSGTSGSPRARAILVCCLSGKRRGLPSPRLPRSSIASWKPSARGRLSSRCDSTGTRWKHHT